MLNVRAEEMLCQPEQKSVPVPPTLLQTSLCLHMDGCIRVQYIMLYAEMNVNCTKVKKKKNTDRFLNIKCDIFVYKC